MPSRDAVFEQTVVYLCKLQILFVISQKKYSGKKLLLPNNAEHEHK